jgi:hypothetical protein
MLLCFKFVDLKTIVINIYFAPPSSKFYNLVKYNISLIYQRWIKSIKRRVYELEIE